MEIERKFLIKNLPDIEQTAGVHYERHFLFIGNDAEIRIQKKGEVYELERKGRNNSISNEKIKLPLTKEEYDYLKKFCSLSLERTSYFLDEHTSIKVYHGTFSGLLRAEFEFASVSDANEFLKPEWCGSEITQSELGRDSKLIQLSEAAFKNLLQTLI